MNDRAAEARFAEVLGRGAGTIGSQSIPHHPDLLILPIPRDSRRFMPREAMMLVATLAVSFSVLLVSGLQRTSLEQNLAGLGFFMALILFAVLLGWWMNRQTQLELRRWLDLIAEASEVIMVQALVQEIARQNPPPNWRLVAQALVLTPVCGKALWLTHAPALTKVTPLDILIEPQRPRELLRLLELKEAGTTVRTPSWRDGWVRPLGGLLPDDRTLATLAGVQGLIIVLVSMLSGPRLVGLHLLVYMGLIVFFLSLRLLASYFGSEHLVVNGGLIERRPQAGGWRLTLLARPDCVWLASPQNDGWVQVHVCTPSGGGCSLTLPTDEAEAFLSAWLSPLASPDPERLADLR